MSSKSENSVNLILTASILLVGAVRAVRNSVAQLVLVNAFR